MEFQDLPERVQRPELDQYSRSSIFMYAYNKQQWLRERVNEHQLPDAIDHLVNELEQYVTSNFETLPDVSVLSQDIQHTKEITGSGTYIVIENEALPFTGDASLFGEHSIAATFFGFHRGRDNDLRVYVSQGNDVRLFMGGIYTPLLSVGLEGSKISLAESRHAEQLEERGMYVKERLGDYTEPMSALVNQLIKELNNASVNNIHRLHNSSQIVADIARQDGVTPQFIDAVLDIIFLKLEMNIPHDIQASAHRVVITERPIPSYKAQRGPTVFEGIIPQLGLIGESASRGIGLFFINNENNVQIPVQYITSMYRNQ